MFDVLSPKSPTPSSRCPPSPLTLTPIELLLVAGVGLVLVVAVVLYRKVATLAAPVPDARIDQIVQRLDRVQTESTQTTQHAIALAERTLHLAQAYKDLESLKERTDQLPKKLEMLEGHTRTHPETHKAVQVLDDRTKVLGKFMTDTQMRLGQVGKQLDPMTRTLPDTAARVTRVESRLGVLNKIDRQLEELHGVFRSTTGKGQIGEDAVRRVLSQFPDDSWVEKPDLPSGTADFGVYTPNGLLLPIDSKTGGADDIKGYLLALERLEDAQRAVDDAEDDAEAEALGMQVREAARRLNDTQRKINDRVRKSAKDIQKYIAPDAGTTPFVLQALPDAVYDAVEPRIRQEASARGVIPVPYDLLHPMSSAVRRMQEHRDVDAERVSAALVKVRESNKAIEDTVKNQVERAATMASNGAQAIRTELGAMNAALLMVEMSEAPEPSQRTLVA